MNKLVNLRDGRVMVVWSDNTDTKTLDVYPVGDSETYHVDSLLCEEVGYNDVVGFTDKQEI